MKVETALFFTLPLCLFNVSAVAQEAPIAPDGTLPTEVNSSGNITEITGGAQAGGNLFHSFSNFSVPNGSEAFFNNAADINNIISRVTGGKISSIDGLIRANGSANLFLLNPAGIVFGENASLNIGGSFLGSTADSLAFPEGEFSATNIQKPLLTINAPIGLNIRDNPGKIINKSNAPDRAGEFVIGLEVKPGKNLSLIGGEVNLEGGNLTAPAGRINIGGLAAAGQVKFNENGSLSFPDRVARGNVSLSNSALVDVTGEKGGSINATANNIQITGNSRLVGGTFADVGLPNSQSGDINLNATGAIDVDESSINNSVGIGNAGNININSKSLNLTNDSQISSSTFGVGNAGNINIKGTDTVSLNTANIFSNVGQSDGTSAEGNVGNIFISAKNVSLIGNETNPAQIQAGFYSNTKGQAGIVSIEAIDSISFDGSSTGIFTDVELNSIANGSDIQLKAKSISLNNGAVLKTSNAGQGKAGNVIINAKDTVKLSNAFISNNILEEGEGSAGNIEIAAKSIDLTNGAGISSSTFGTGNAGNVTIKAIDRVSLDASKIFSNVGQSDGTPAAGNVGNIKISAKNVSLTRTGTNAAQIQAGFYSNTKGNSGIVGIEATDSISFDGLDTAIFTDVFQNSSGNGSDIQLKAKSISFTNGAGLEASNAGGGNGGKIDINTNNLQLDRSKIQSEAAFGAGGNINLQVKDTISLRNQSNISSLAINDADGGNITINAPDGFVLAFPNQNNDILATAQAGKGGQINIDSLFILGFDKKNIQSITDTKTLLNNGENDINSTSEQPGSSGKINIKTIDPIKRTAQSSQDVVEPDTTVAQACDAEGNGGIGNSFTITGRGGMPADPTKPLNSSIMAGSGGAEVQRGRGEKETRKQSDGEKKVLSSDEIIPARGVAFKGARD